MDSESNETNSPLISRQLKIIQRFALSLLRQNSLEDLTWDIAFNAGQILGFEDCVVYLRDGDMLVQHAAYGIKNPIDRTILSPIQIPIGKGIVGTVAETQKGEIVSDTSSDPRYIFDEFSGKSEITVPIVYQGKTIGILDSESSQPNKFSPLDFELFQSVADIASSRIASAINEKEIQRTQQHLIKYKQELESKVIERTQRISDTLETVRLHETCLRHAQNELETERDWLRSILESVSDGIIATNELGIIQMISDSAATILGKDGCHAGNQIQSILTIASDEDSIFDGSGNLVETSFKGTITTDLGAKKIIQCSARSVRQTSSSDLAFVISLQDITLQTYLEAEAEKAQRLDSLGILAGGIAHDFNNQLAAVCGLISVAKIADRKSRTELLDLAEQTCLKSKTLTDQLLSLSAGGEPSIQPCDVLQMLRDTKQIASAGSSIKFQFNDDHDLPLIEADPGQLRLVFDNIIINAQQAMGDKGQIRIDPEIIAIEGKQMVQIKIQDNGPGIDARDIPKIFDPYFTTKNTGHGLGLTTSYSIVQRHHGHLTVSSTPGEGSTFSIALPISDAGVTVESPQICESISTLEILLLEDDELVQKSVTALLASLGHRVTCATNGSAAIAEFTNRLEQKRGFDLAILDRTIIGGMGGFQTMLKLKELDKDLPAISISGYAFDSSLGENIVFDGYLQKPFNADQLREAIDSVFSETNASRQGSKRDC